MSQLESYLPAPSSKLIDPCIPEHLFFISVSMQVSLLLGITHGGEPSWMDMASQMRTACIACM